jgi:protein-S-isoprenylcysteine O-methyltransferase Ste14
MYLNKRLTIIIMSISLPWLFASILSIIFFTVMAKLEEIDLSQRMPKYSDYMVRVPGFLPYLILLAAL